LSFFLLECRPGSSRPEHNLGDSPNQRLAPKRRGGAWIRMGRSTVEITRHLRPRVLFIVLVVAAVLDEHLFNLSRLQRQSHRDPMMPALVIGGTLGHPDSDHSWRAGPCVAWQPATDPASTPCGSRRQAPGSPEESPPDRLKGDVRHWTR
jgi:hypothetical protein